VTPADRGALAQGLTLYVLAAKGWTQADLAHALGVARSTVTRWQNRARGVSPDNLRKLLQFTIEHLNENG
jgi:transcriptional regulator with XRE-family HTH domain